MVVKFDLSSIPADAKIKEAKLSLYPFKKYYEGANGPKSLFSLKKGWTESSVTWNTPWATKGGEFDATAVAKSSNTAVNVWEEYTVTPVVKDVVEKKVANNGFLLKFDSMTPKHGVTFHSSESTQSTLRPKLVVTYEASTGVLPDQLAMPAITGACKVTVTTVQGRRIVSSFEVRNADQLNRVRSQLSSGVHIVTIQTPGKNFRKVWVTQ